MRRQPKIIFPTTVSEIGLVYKSKVAPKDRPTLRSSADAASVFRQYWNPDTIELQEEMKVLYTNQRLQVLGLYHAFTGGISSTEVDIRLILVAALRLGASGIFLCHCHPSGNLIPSGSDRELTRKIKEAARLHNIRLNDHIIITAESYYSFTDEGLI